MAERLGGLAVDATAGGLGASVALATLYPLVVVKVRLQAQRKKREGDSAAAGYYTGPLDCLVKSLASGGVLDLYAGLPFALVRAFINNYVFYFVLSFLRRFFFPKGVKGRSVIRSLAHGMSAGVVVQLCITPFDIILNRLMTSRAGLAEIVQGLYASGGIAAFWCGIGPALVLTANPAITTLVRNLLTPSEDGGAGKNFATGLLSKCIASLTTYPYTIVKVQMQAGKEKGSGSSGIEGDGEKDREGAQEADAMWVDVVKVVPPPVLADGSLSASGTGDGVCTTPVLSSPSSSMPESGQLFTADSRITGAPGEESESALARLAELYRQGGVGAIYRGCSLQVSNAMLKEAILNMVRLEINAAVRRLAGDQE